jgi:hypothetical protein
MGVAQSIRLTAALDVLLLWVLAGNADWTTVRMLLEERG